MGTVPQSETTNLEVVRGTIEQALLSTGLNSVLEIIQDPSVMAKSALEAVQTGFAVATQSTQNPFAIFDWAIKSVTSAINVAVTSSNFTESTKKATDN
jgi:hypothetical protein